MADPINTGSIPRLLEEGINETFGNEFNRHPLQWPQMFQEDPSTKNFETDQMVEGFNAAVDKDEGAGVSFDTMSQGYTPVYRNVTTALGYMVTEETLEDDLYDVVVTNTARLADSMRNREETRGASILNNGFDSAFLQEGGDGVELFSQLHPQGPNSNGGTYQNELTVAASLSEASLEDMLILIGDATDNRGLQIQLRDEKLLIPNALKFTAERILKSTLRVETADNDINAIKNMGMLPGGALVNNFFTDTNAWFVKTDARNGLRHFTRRAISTGRDNAFTTGNLRVKSTKRDVFGWSEPRSIFGSQGA